MTAHKLWSVLEYQTYIPLKIDFVIKIQIEIHPLSIDGDVLILAFESMDGQEQFVHTYADKARSTNNLVLV